MGFVAKIKGKRVDNAPICDACGTEIDYDNVLYAAVIVAPPREGVPRPIRFACNGTCEGTLLRAAGEGAGAADLEDWWKGTAIVLGFDDPKEPGTVEIADVVAALPDLEALARKPSMPTGLTLSDALALGYVHPGHVAAVLAASSA